MIVPVKSVVAKEPLNDAAVTIPVALILLASLYLSSESIIEKVSILQLSFLNIFQIQILMERINGNHVLKF